MGSDVGLMNTATQISLEERSLWTEAARRTRVFHYVEGEISYTPDFLKTLVSICEDDYFWGQYIGLIDIPFEPLNRDDAIAWNDPMNKLANALVCVHVKRIQIPCESDDLRYSRFMLATHMARGMHEQDIYTGLSDEDYREITQDRNEWMNLV